MGTNLKDVDWEWIRDASAGRASPEQERAAEMEQEVRIKILCSECGQPMRRQGLPGPRWYFYCKPCRRATHG